MRFYDAAEITVPEAWGAVDLLEIQDATVRLHWTDQPYIWHVNDGPEAFVVLDGQVDMHFRDADGEHVRRLRPGLICLADIGDEHVARPLGQARILVVEQRGSV